MRVGDALCANLIWESMSFVTKSIIKKTHVKISNPHWCKTGHFQHIFHKSVLMPHRENCPQSQWDTLQLLYWCLLDLQDLGDVLAHLVAAALWIKMALKNAACAAVDSKAFLRVWISVLGLVPRVPAAKQGWENFFSLLHNTSRGGCAQVRRSTPDGKPILSSHTLKKGNHNDMQHYESEH